MSAAALTTDAVERGYNNRAAVADHPRFLAQYPALSQATRARYRPRVGLRYGPNPRETLDLFAPAVAAKGTFVFLHGGYWRAFGKDDFSFVAGPLVDEGIAVAVVDYDLCPDVSIATIVDECARALAWVQREGARHGAGADVVVGGHSAGGHLAAMMYTIDWTARGLARAPFVGGLTLSGVHDLAPLVQFSFNVDFRLDDAEAARVSPINRPVRTDAPLLIACGAGETSEFLRQSQLLWDAWPRNRRPAEAPMFIPGKHHFSVVLDHAEADSALTRATLALF
ncbi:MAG: alpha/beta hydrolase [Burkholderiales bacterium]